jgi:hypothetical protein
VESEARVDFEIRDNQLAAVTVDPSTIQSGGISTATITLEGPAPPGGKKVYLSSSNAQLIPVPETLMIPGGSTSTSLKLRTTSNLQIGQAIIRASIKKPLKMAVSKFSGMNVLGRGIPEPDESQMIENQEMSEVAGITPEAGESSAPSLSNNAQQEEQLESDVLAPEGNITQDQEITERGFTGFGEVRGSRFPSSVLATKPNQGALSAFPDVVKTPSPTPPGVPIPYPNVSDSNVAQPNSKIQEITKLDNSLLTKPGPSGSTSQTTSKVQEVVKSQKFLITKPSEAKEAVITVQNSILRTNPLVIPNVPPLQK